MSETIVSFYGYKNLINQNGISFCIHDGHYAVRIKTIVHPLHLKEEDIEIAYEHCQSTFFEMVDMVTDIFGYKTYSITGRSGGYVEPLIDGYQMPKPIDAVHDEYISFDDYIIQQKMDSYAQQILSIKSSIESVYKHSKNINELLDLIEKIHEGVVYV